MLAYSSRRVETRAAFEILNFDEDSAEEEGDTAPRSA
jgi:hypothetical protein